MTHVNMGKVGKTSVRAMVPPCAVGAVTAAGTVGSALFVCRAGAHNGNHTQTRTYRQQRRMRCG